MPLQALNPAKIATVSVSAAGNTSIIAAVAGVTITVLGVVMTAGSNVASTGGATILVDLFDGASTALNVKASFFAPNASVTTGSANPLQLFNSFPYGAVRGTAGNVLNVNLSAALTSGAVQVTVTYTAEV